jgi:P pilus assembly chaperone PapD
MRTWQSKFGKLAAAGVLAAILHAIGWASSFSVNPVRVELSTGKLTSVVKVNNSGDESLMMQVSVLRWTTDGARRRGLYPFPVVPGSPSRIRG